MISLSSVVVEVTRRCNLQCEHCMRGDAQSLDLDPRLFKAFLDKLSEDVEQISNITFTGGEPFLVPGVVQKCVEIIKQHRIEIGGIWTSTNGHIIGEDAQDAVLAMLRYNSGMRGWGDLSSCIRISTDQYHEPLSGEEEAWWSVFSRIEFQQPEKRKIEFVIPEGRGIDVSAYELEWPRIKEIDIVDCEQFEEDVYLNAKGEVSIGCNFSYETQDERPHMPVSKFTLGKLVEASNKFVLLEV